jgi:hypothetical protein
MQLYFTKYKIHIFPLRFLLKAMQNRISSYRFGENTKEKIFSRKEGKLWIMIKMGTNKA